MKKKLWHCCRYAILPMLFILLFSCTEDEENNTPRLDKLLVTEATGIHQRFKVELYANDSLLEGYNPLFFRITEVGTEEIIIHAEIKLAPLMDMIDMVHSAPYENPPETANEEKLFEGAMVFLMPSTPEMGWTLDVIVSENGTADTVPLVIPKVNSLEEARKINVISQIDDTKYFVSLVEPVSPLVGINDFELTVHYKENMMLFPAAEDLTIEIEPEMPSMDHGSPNNVNPVHTGNGHYVGKVNFTMTGWWRVHLTLKKDGQVLAEDTWLDITF